MKLLSSFFFILLISSFIPLILTPASAATPQTTRGKDYVDVNYGNGTHVWSSAPEWILDNGVYKPYKLFEDSSTVKVETMQGSFIFDKNSCSLSFYNNGVIGGQQPTIGSDSYLALGTTLGSQNFVKVNSINNAVCQTTVIESGNDIEVQGTKHVDNVGTFKVRYIKLDGQDLKSQIEPTNENPAWTNHKLGITQTMQVPRMIQLGNETKDLANFNGTVLDRTWLINHKSQLIKLSNSINFDFDLGFQHVEKITISWNGSVAKLIIDYWYNTPQISPGQTLIIDPTFSSSDPTEDGQMKDDDNSGTCGDDPTPVRLNSGTTMDVITNISTSTDDCSRAYVEFNTSTIPNDADVTNVILKVDVQTVTNGRNCDFMPIVSQPSTASGTTLMTDIGDGTPYISNTATCSSLGLQSFDLGTSADTDLENLLINGWFAAGVKHTSEAQDGSTHQNSFIAEEGIGDIDPTLEVTYIGLLDAIDDLTILQTTGTTVILDWTAPDAHELTITGYQINYTTPFGEPLTIVSNNASASRTQGTVSGLTELTQYSFRVSARTEVGINATGNIANTTTLKDLSFGSLNLTATNPDIIPIRFERDDISDTALFLNITYSNTFLLSCDMHYKFAQINRTYTSITDVPLTASDDEASFRFNDVDNEVIDVFCWNQLAGARNSTNVNSTNSGRYIITQTDFLLLQQISDFRNGEFGTQGMFGVLDLVTISVFIIAMIGLNRIDQSVGGIILVMVIGALTAFQIIAWPTFFLSAIAVSVMLAVAAMRKNI